MITTQFVSEPELLADTAQPCVDMPALGVADLTFITRIDKTDFGESWLAKTPDGKAHICQFVPPNDPDKNAKLLARLCAYRHADLIPWFALCEDPTRPALLAAIEGPTLADRFRELWATSRPGVPRDELLGYLRTAALVLDQMHSRHQAQHLWLEPRQFVLRKVKRNSWASGWSKHGGRQASGPPPF